MKTFHLKLGLLLLLAIGCTQHRAISQISDSIDVTHYRLYFDSLDFAQKQIHARADIYVTPANPQNPVEGITLELLGLQVDSVFQGTQEINTFTHPDTLLQFTLPAPLLHGDTAQFTIYYSGTPHVESYNWGGFHFQGSLYAYNLGVAIEDIPHNYGKVMFPCVDDFIDRATYEFLIRTPSGMRAAANGILHNHFTNPDGSITWHWILNQSIPTYLACMAVSDYIVLSDTFQSVSGPIPVTIHVRPQDSADAAGSFQNLLQVCQLFEEKYGAYPFERIGYVIAPKGAMEHATCITYPSSTVDGNLTYEYLYAHELAHMWFGDMVTCENAGEMWLNEGWATFSEFIYKEGLYSIDVRKNYVRNMLQGILQFAHIEEGGYRPLYGMPQQFTYGNTIYDKGACVAHTLRGYLGDSLFFPAVRKYLELKSFDHASSEDMMNIMGQESGIDLEDFFDAWVYNPGFPHFRIDSFRIVPPSLPPSSTVEVFFSQQGKGTTTLANSNRLDVLFMNDQWDTHVAKLTFSGASGSAITDVPFIPQYVFIDPEERVCDATTDMFKKIIYPGKREFITTFFELQVEGIQDSALVRATHHWVPPDSLEQAVPGFQTSDYRYWSVNGVWPGGMDGKLRFFYSKFSYLDNGIINHYEDSVVLMYREGPGDPWEPFPATMEGQTYQGYMVTDTIVRGDFCIGIWDHTFLSTSKPGTTKKGLEVFPNPSADTFVINTNWDDVKELRVYSMKGDIVYSNASIPPSEEFRWDSGDLPSGTYFLMIYGENGNILGEARLIKK